MSVFYAFCSDYELSDTPITANSQRQARVTHKALLEADGYVVTLSPWTEEVWAVKNGHEYVFYGYSEE